MFFYSQLCSMKRLLLLLFLLAGALQLHAGEAALSPSAAVTADTLQSDTLHPEKGKFSRALSRAENQRLIAAILAFPFPFGITGLHRIYLGTSPWVPVVYFATLGGFGILPLTDFIAIVSASDADFKTYLNNGNVFMWVK